MIFLSRPITFGLISTRPARINHFELWYFTEIPVFLLPTIRHTRATMAAFQPSTITALLLYLPTNNPASVPSRRMHLILLLQITIIIIIHRIPMERIIIIITRPVLMQAISIITPHQILMGRITIMLHLPLTMLMEIPLEIMYPVSYLSAVRIQLSRTIPAVKAVYR